MSNSFMLEHTIDELREENVKLRKLLQEPHEGLTITLRYSSKGEIYISKGIISEAQLQNASAVINLLITREAESLIHEFIKEVNL